MSIQKLEIFQKSRQAEMPNNILLNNLIGISFNGEYVSGGPSTNLRHILNKDYNPSYQDFEPIAGEFGLHLVDEETKKGVAVCSFNLIFEKGNPIMQVVHTPQGLQAKTWTKSGRTRAERARFLKNSNFRQYMLNGLLEIARSIGCSRVEVVSTINHPKFIDEEIDLATGYRIIDQVAINCGFKYNRTRNLVLALSLLE